MRRRDIREAREFKEQFRDQLCEQSDYPAEDPEYLDWVFRNEQPMTPESEQ